MVVVVIDATEGVTEQDAKIAGIAHERGKGIIIAVNKWDAVEKNDKTIYKYTNEIRNTLSFMPYAEIMFISAVDRAASAETFRDDRYGSWKTRLFGYRPVCSTRL